MIASAVFLMLLAFGAFRIFSTGDVYTPRDARPPEGARSKTDRHGRATPRAEDASRARGVTTPESSGKSGTKLGEIWALEEEGKLSEALQRLRGLDGPEGTQLKPHTEYLTAVLAAEKTADALGRRHEPLRAWKTFDTVAAKADPLRDTHLESFLLSRGAELEDALRAETKREADARLATADALFKAGSYAEAIKAYDDVLALKDDASLQGASPYPETYLRDVRVKRLAAEAAQAHEQNPGYLRRVTRTLWEALRTGSQWLLYIIFVLGLLWLLMQIPKLRRPVKATTLVVQDSDAADAERLVKGQAATKEVLLVLSELAELLGDSGLVELPRDQDGTPFANIRMTDDTLARQVGELIKDDQSNAIQIGPVSISGRAFYSLISPYLERPPQTSLTGTLAKIGDRTVLSLSSTVSRRLRSPVRTGPWDSVADGPDDSARTKAVRETAIRIFYNHLRQKNAKTGAPMFTESWSSFRDTIVALALLGKEDL